MWTLVPGLGSNVICVIRTRNTVRESFAIEFRLEMFRSRHAGRFRHCDACTRARLFAVDASRVLWFHVKQRRKSSDNREGPPVGQRSEFDA